MTWGYLDRASIRDVDPLSAKLQCERRYELGRGPWQIGVETTSTMTADDAVFHIDDRLEAYEGARRVFVRSWSRTVPRDYL